MVVVVLGITDNGDEDKRMNDCYVMTPSAGISLSQK